MTVVHQPPGAAKFGKWVLGQISQMLKINWTTRLQLKFQIRWMLPRLKLNGGYQSWHFALNAQSSH